MNDMINKYYQNIFGTDELDQRLHNIKRRKLKVDFELICKIVVALDIDLNEFKI